MWSPTNTLDRKGENIIRGELIGELGFPPDAQGAPTSLLLWIESHTWCRQRPLDLAMFNLAIDSKLRGCDVVALNVEAGSR
jgi:hypothetical protein